MHLKKGLSWLTSSKVVIRTFQKCMNLKKGLSWLTSSKVVFRTFQKCMNLKKGISWLTSSKVVFRTFLATHKQIIQSYSSCITDCQHDFEKRKHLENTSKYNKKESFLPLSMIMKLSMILDSLSLDKCVPSSFFLQISHAWIQKLINTNSQTDQATWVD